MKQLDLIIQNPTGLHARPAKLFVKLAKQFQSDVRVVHGPKTANAKSLISMLTLGVECGGQVQIVVEGEDEEQAIEALEAAVQSGLGEKEAEETHKDDGSQSAEPERLVEAARDGFGGIPAAPGIAIGPVFQLKRSEIVIAEEITGTPEQETAQLQEALGKARRQLVTLRNQLIAGDVSSEADIFDVHLELLEDADLLDAVLAGIQNGQNAALAWQATIETRSRTIAALQDPLLAARAADLHDVGYRVLRVLMGIDEQAYALPEKPVVVVARDLSPSESASLDRERVLGFCTAMGGPTSHTAIIARALGLPAIVGAGEKVLDLKNGTQLILNGSDGSLIVDPDQATVDAARTASQRWLASRSEARLKAADPAITLDGRAMEVVANIGGLADAQLATQMGAEGVGLLRTEFLFLDREDAPSEKEQFSVYRDIAQTMAGLPVIIRTLDIGGDKPLPYVEVPPEDNPFLGERGIRLCLNRPDLFRQQLRAILRASEFGKLRIMFPMVADLSEWREARALVENIRLEFKLPQVEMGIMIEVPSAALMADVFAREVDFFSIGTNDLTQYTLAMDRMHPTLARKSDGLHPAVLRLIARTVEAAHREGKWVGVCGELGADPMAVPVLLGLGVDELSVSVPAIPTVKAQIRRLDASQAASLARQVLDAATAVEVREIIRTASGVPVI